MAPYAVGIFFQANTVKGYEAWDKTGVVANELSTRFAKISYGPLGLVCESPVDPKDYLLQVRVNVQHILLSFLPRARFDTIQRESVNRVEWIAKATNVTEFSRLGLRTQLIWGRESEEQASHEIRDRFLSVQMHGWSALGVVQSGELALNVEIEDLIARVALQPAKRNPDEKTASNLEESAPEFGIMLDVDIAKNGNTYYTDLQSYFRRCERVLYEHIIPHIERQFEGGIVT